MMLKCKGWFVISHLWRWELLQTATVRLGIDTLIANILVLLQSTAIAIAIARDCYILFVLLQSPAIAEDCYILVVLFFLFFSVHQIFDIPGPIFAKLYHTTRYVLK